MATSVPINIITGRTGTAHVSSGDDAAIWRGLVGSPNVVLSQGSQLELQDNGVVNNMGSLTIRDGVFSTAGGHMGRIADAHTVEYNLPSENNYRRTMVVIRYLNDSTTESMTLMTLKSAQEDDVSPQSSSQSDVDAAINAAKVLTVDGYNSSSDYIIYDFVCSADGIVSGTLKTMFATVDNIPMLRESVELEKLSRISDVSTLTTRIATEESARAQDVSTLTTRIATEETTRTQLGASVTELSNTVNNSNTGINKLNTRIGTAENNITSLRTDVNKKARVIALSLKSPTGQSFSATKRVIFSDPTLFSNYFVVFNLMTNVTYDYTTDYGTYQGRHEINLVYTPAQNTTPIFSVISPAGRTMIIRIGSPTGDTGIMVEIISDYGYFQNSASAYVVQVTY